jgi:hypothetical protein
MHRRATNECATGACSPPCSMAFSLQFLRILMVFPYSWLQA